MFNKSQTFSKCTLWKPVFCYFTDLYSYDGRSRKEQIFEYFQSARHCIYEFYLHSLNLCNNPFALIWSAKTLSGELNLDLPCFKVIGQVTCTYFRNYLKDWMITQYFPVLFPNTGFCIPWTSRISPNPCFSTFQQVALNLQFLSPRELLIKTPKAHSKSTSVF